VPYIKTGVVVVSIAVPLEFSLATVTLYCPVVVGLVILPVGIIKPYSVELVKLADVRPETSTEPPVVPPLLVTVAVEVLAVTPGGKVMLAGVRGKTLSAVGFISGVPAVIAKPLGKVTNTLATLVGVVFSLKVTSRSLLALALVASRPRRTLD
jgi:hypothetical protein